MRKDICSLDDEDIQNFVILVSNHYTYKTLLCIDKIKHDPKAALDIQSKIKQTEERIENYKYSLLLKYNIPYYINMPMFIDSENKVMYINIKKN